MQIIEIYKSLQGESSYAGLPCVFVRLAGCNLRCSLVRQRVHLQGRQRMTLEEVEPRCIAFRPTAAWWRSPAASLCCRSAKRFR